MAWERSGPWCKPTLTNCTITANSAGDAGGVSSSDDATVFLVNCIEWGNSPGPPYNQGLYSSLNDRDPLFVDPARGDFRLQAGSPALDAGTEEGAPFDDFAGIGRPCGAGVDLGAHESGGCLPPSSVTVVIRVSPERGGTTDPPAGSYAFSDRTHLPLAAEPASGYRFWLWEGAVKDQSVPRTAARIEGRLLTTVTAFFYPRAFVRGDANSDFRTDIADPIALLDHLFQGNALPCLAAADANDDRRLDLADPVRLLERLFLGAGPLPEPTGSCGSNPAGEGLVCESFPGCE